MIPSKTDGHSPTCHPERTPGLLSGALDRMAAQPSTFISKAAASQQRHVLPKDLPGAIKYLPDQELEWLIVAALAEQKRRGTKPVVTASPRLQVQRVEVARAALTTGKLNAVRAAFKAGVKPTQIARQFGLSDTDVRNALSGERKR